MKRILRQHKQLWMMTLGFLMGMALLWCSGCASADGVPRALEADYGRSVTNARLGMMVTPPDAVDAKPPVGLSPQVTANVGGKYDKSFKDKEPPPTIRWLFQ
jgi:hypothetical protein